MTSTQVPSRVRATARPRTPATPAEPAPPVAMPDHHRLGEVGVIRLVLAELILLAIVLSVALGPAEALLGGSAGIAIVALLFLRSHGRWWTDELLLRWRLRQRQARPVHPDADPRLTQLRRLAPGLTTVSVPVPGSTPIGVGHDGSGWFAAAVLTDDAVRDGRRTTVPLDSLLDLVCAPDTAGSLQVVTYTLPAADGEDASSRSYRELLAGSPGPVPAHQATWVAVRLAPPNVGTLRDDGEEADLVTTAATQLRNACRRLTRAGVACQPLLRDELVEALLRTCDLDTITATPPKERWTAWRTGLTEQACFWVRRWPQANGWQALLSLMSSIPAVPTSVALVCRPTPHGTRVRCLLRVTAAPGELEAACRTARSLVHGAGGRLLRLDGEHAPAVYATIPTAAGMP